MDFPPKLVAVAVSLGALLFAVYLWASFALPGPANALRYSSGIFDMDVSRVVADLTTERRAFRSSVHPLQKLLVAPLGRLANAALFDGRNPLGAAKVVIAIAMTLQALAVGWLASQLARGSVMAGVCAALICGLSFSSLLAATIPESAALSCLGSTVPLIFLNARMSRRLGWGEAAAWGLIALFCLAFTITQIAHCAIALLVRLALLSRSTPAGQSPLRGGHRWAMLVLIAAVVATGAWAGARLQSFLYPGTPPFYSESPVEAERAFFRVDALKSEPAEHTARLASHFLLYDFAAPRPAFSDFLIRDFGLGFWSLSLEEAGAENWSDGQRALAAALLLAVLASVLSLRRADSRFIAPALSVASQFALHLVYGREYILYSPHWHGVLVALLTASAWRALGRRRFVLPLASAILSGAMLANGVAVLKEVYREVALGLDADLRDERGRIRPPLRRRWLPPPSADGPARPGARVRPGIQGRGESW
jgi:hypothetical protein